MTKELNLPWTPYMLGLGSFLFLQPPPPTSKPKTLQYVVDRWTYIQDNTTQKQKTKAPPKNKVALTHTKDCQPLKEPVWERVRSCLHQRGPWQSPSHGDNTTRPNLMSSPHLYPIVDSDKSPTNAWIRILSKGISICKTDYSKSWYIPYDRLLMIDVIFLLIVC
jgi:hypothetical protein